MERIAIALSVVRNYSKQMSEGTSIFAPTSAGLNTGALIRKPMLSISIHAFHVEKSSLQHIKTVSSAVPHAIQNIVFMEVIMQLSKYQMERQSLYESSLFFVQSMLTHGIITPSEFVKAKGFLEAKYCPVIRH